MSSPFEIDIDEANRQIVAANYRAAVFANAAKAMGAAATPEDRLRFAFRRVLGRKPTETDLRILGKALEKQRAIYAADPEAARKFIAIGTAPVSGEFPAEEQAALAAVCLGMLNLDEALTRE